MPAAVIIKHTNPCGAAIAPEGEGVLAAYRRARETDPVSAFGGIVAVNRPVEAELAKEMAETFLECVVAPGLRARGAGAAVGEEGPAPAEGRDRRPAIPAELELRSVAGGRAGADPRRRHQLGGGSGARWSAGARPPPPSCATSTSPGGWPST